MPNTEYSVGQVAKRAGVKVSTLHFYEQKGLIFSLRNSGNQRRYKPEVLRRVSVIKAAQRLGVTLDEIKLAFSSLPDNKTPDKADWEKLSTRWHAMLDQRIKKLETLRDSLSSCIGCGCLSLKSCPMYNTNDCLGDGHSGPVILDEKTASQ